MDRGDAAGIAKAIAMALAMLAIFAMICVLFSCGIAADEAEPTRPTPDELGIVKYASPMGASEHVSDCWHLQDRQRHHDWWLVRLDGQWVALDAGEVREP